MVVAAASHVVSTSSAFLGSADLQTFVLTWLPLALMCALVYFLFRLLRNMPRTKPAQIKPERAPAIGWNDIAGVDEAKEELREVVDYMRDPKHFRKLGARV